MAFISRVATTGVLALAAGSGYHFLTNRHSAERSQTVSEVGGRSASIEYARFSPSENLERVEIGELRAAAQRLRRARAPLNVAMYAFTDRAIAQVLVEEADAGIEIRVYRDGEQYAAEQRESERSGRSSVASMFRGHNNIHMRVKPASRIDLMHLKCWSDGQVLREAARTGPRPV